MRLNSWPWMGAAVAAVLLSGCASINQPGSGSPAAPPARASCDAQAAQFALGKSFGPALEREVRAKSGASVVRVLSPGQTVMTLEFRAERVNLTLDGRGQVVKATCG